METVIAVASGGALGAVLRYWLYNFVHDLMGKGFPYGTIAVNVLGSLAMGFLYVWLFDRYSLGSQWRAFLLVGLLGGFTTFSAFSIETVNLAEQGEYLKSLSNIGVSVIACVGAAGLGVVIATHVE